MIWYNAVAEFKVCKNKTERENKEFSDYDISLKLRKDNVCIGMNE